MRRGRLPTESKNAMPLICCNEQTSLTSSKVDLQQIVLSLSPCPTEVTQCAGCITGCITTEVFFPDVPWLAILIRKRQLWQEQNFLLKLQQTGQAPEICESQSSYRTLWALGNTCTQACQSGAPVFKSTKKF
jgi:hypothetical protein